MTPLVEPSFPGTLRRRLIHPDTTVNLNIPIRSSKSQGLSPAEQRHRAETIANWLRSDEPTPQTRPLAARGTLTWFFEHHLYTSWLNTQASATILQGNVGCGKTTLVNHIDQKLNESLGSSGARIITFYCSDLSNSSTCVDRFLRTTLIGAARFSDIPQPLLRLYEQHNSHLVPRQPSTDDLGSIVVEIISSSVNDIYIVVDALDEVQDSERSDIIEFLNRLANEKVNRLHLLLVTRPGVFLRRFQNSDRWSVKTLPREQIRRDINHFVRDEFERRETLHRLNVESRERVVDRLITNDNDRYGIENKCQLLKS